MSDIFSPVSGEIVEVNQELTDHPELVNEDPYDKGWILSIEIQDVSELDNLLTADEYKAYLGEIAH